MVSTTRSTFWGHPLQRALSERLTQRAVLKTDQVN